MLFENLNVLLENAYDVRAGHRPKNLETMSRRLFFEMFIPLTE